VRGLQGSGRIDRGPRFSAGKGGVGADGGRSSHRRPTAVGELVLVGVHVGSFWNVEARETSGAFPVPGEGRSALKLGNVGSGLAGSVDYRRRTWPLRARTGHRRFSWSKSGPGPR